MNVNRPDRPASSAPAIPIGRTAIKAAKANEQIILSKLDSISAKELMSPISTAKTDSPSNSLPALSQVPTHGSAVKPPLPQGLEPLGQAQLINTTRQSMGSGPQPKQPLPASTTSAKSVAPQPPLKELLPVPEVQSSAPPLPKRPNLSPDQNLVRNAILKLDVALKISRSEGNNSALRGAIRETEAMLGQIIDSNPSPSNPLAKDLIACREKLSKCQEIRKNELLSEKKVKVVALILADQTEPFFMISQEEIESAVRKATKKQANTLEINGQVYIVSKTVPGSDPQAIPAVWKRNAQSLDSGTFGVIYGGKYIGETGKGRDDIMKEANPNAKDVEKAKKDVINEFNVANDLHSTGRKAGIQQAPHSLIAGDRTGYLARREDMNGDTLGKNIVRKSISLTPTEKHMLALQATSGLTDMHNIGYYHGDNKGLNLLYNAKEKNLYVADLGGARKFSELVPLTSFPSISTIYTGCTPEYVSDVIHNQIKKILDENEQKYNRISDPIKKEEFLRNMLSSEIVPLLKKNDKFAMGSALYETFVGAYVPFDEGGEFRRERYMSKLDNTDKTLDTISENMKKTGLEPQTITLILDLIKEGVGPTA